MSIVKEGYKKRHSQSTMNAKRQANEAKIAEEKDRARKRMDPTARTLLLGDLVFLAIVSMLDQAGMLSDYVSAFCTAIGIVLLLAGLWFQFGKKAKEKSYGRKSDWPGL